MTNDLNVNNNPSPAPDRPASYTQAASIICLLAGIWFFVSPWVYGAAGSGNAWNSWIVGAAVFLIGATRAGRPLYSAGLSWLNMLLGIWVFFSPWIFGYVAHSDRLVNSLCVGVIVFVLASVAAFSNRHSTVPAINRT